MSTTCSLPSNDLPDGGRRWGWALALVCILAMAGIALAVRHGLRAPDSQEVVVRGQTDWATGGTAALRVYVRHWGSDRPVAGARVVLRLVGKSGSAHLGSLATGADGCLADPMQIPDLPPGEYTLVVDVVSGLGRDHVERIVRLFRPAQVLLTTDKPVFQPGQTMHLRALVLNDRTRHPRGNEPVVFEVNDGRGNRVFRAERTTSRFGLASADFKLADEVNTGRYHVHAAAAAAQAERTVDVKPYVLPKFRVTIAPERTWYRPGQIVAGTVSAQYFFGKPVAGARLELTAITLEHVPVTVGALEVRTDERGEAAFRFTLPFRFVGLPQTDAQAALELAARVTDGAGHAEQATLSLPVADADLTLAIVPENGALAPGLENLVYVLAAYPDGAPAACAITAGNQQVRTDATGVARLLFTPTPTGEPLAVTARDEAGRTASTQYRMEAAPAAPSLLVRANQAVYRAGETARITVLTTEPAGTVFVDVVRQRQTALTRSVPIARGRGELAFALTPDLTGLLRINAYTMSAEGEWRGNSRLVHVRPSVDLHVTARPDRTVYGPGETARLEIAVRDAAGQPTVAALGLCAVDESVFSLEADPPGMLAQVAAAERELRKPRFQSQFFDVPTRLLQTADQRPLLAEAYLASLADGSERRRRSEEGVENQLFPGALERLRRARGTPAYEALRRNPELAEAIRLVEGASTDSEWSECTGPAKARAATEQRERFFDNVKRAGAILLVATFLPTLLGGYYTNARRELRRTLDRAGASANERPVIEIAVLQQTALGCLYVLQFLWYPAVLVVLEIARLSNREVGYVSLAGEAAVVLTVLAWRGAELRGLALAGAAQEGRALAWVLALFLGQFVAVRGLVAGAASSGFQSAAGELMWVWLLAGVVTPCAALAYGGSQVRAIVEARSPGKPFVRPFGWLEVALVLLVLFILAAMLLPALAKSKAKAMRITAANDLKQVQVALQLARQDGTAGPEDAASCPQPRVRRHFPETLFWQPELITDEQGRVTVDIPLADSITTWRTAVDAVGAAGQLGSAEVPLRVFQDFFVELDLPAALSLGDRIAVPVMCYNYLGTPQTVRLAVREDDWFHLAEAAPTAVVALEPNEVRSVHFPIQARRVGSHRLVVTARTDRASDAVEREVRVDPTGTAIERVENALLRDRAEFGFNVPRDAIPGSASLLLKLYPSRFSEIVEGLDTIFQAPNGCFEQTSATTYPNVLALAYLQNVGRLTPEIEVKARAYINAGYQRLLTFEVPGGGFEWFGRSPANIGLSAYGVLEFTDMARVHPVDERVIDRTVAWLESVQTASGAWQPQHRGETWSGPGPLTAFVAWALAESGRPSGCLDKALAYLRSHPDELDTTYARALAANAFLARDPQNAFGRALARQLLAQAIRTAPGHVNWTSIGTSMTYSTGPGFAVETTALAALALAKTDESPDTLNQALAWLSAAKTANGTWGTTQATILAMRALLQATSSADGRTTSARLSVTLNGRRIESLEIGGPHRDVLQWVSLTKHLSPGENRLELDLDPAGELVYQAAGAYWIAAGVPVAQGEAPAELELTQRYDRTALALSEVLRCTVSARNRTAQTIPMAIIDLGIPAGFEVDPQSFQAMQTQGRIARYELTGRQAILYLRDLPAGLPLEFTYQLRARYPLRVEAPPASVYEYYTPSRRASSHATTLEVRP